jgi:beta-glucosidase
MNSGNGRVRFIGLTLMALSLTVSSAAQALGSATPSSASSPPNAMNAPATPTVRYLIGRLTADEKISLVHGVLGEGIVAPVTPTDPGANGAIGVVAGVPRLGIPTFRHVDSNGINLFADSTAYPGRLGIAAAFDRSAVTQFGTALGKEGRALGADLVYAPQTDLARFPSWARNLTSYGEDPYLTEQLATADVRAIQNTHLLAQVKHFAFYNGQDQDAPSIIDERAAHELYLKAYESALINGGASSVMCSYAKYQVAGPQSSPAYSCENDFGLQTVLRGELGFTGWVTSDYGASHATSDILGGMDQEFLTSNLAPGALKPLVDPTSATFDASYARALDGAVTRILYQYQRFGRLDDRSYPAWAKTHVQPAPAPAPFDERTGITIARRLAEESAVLLKNSDGVLPLARSAGSSVAVIGPTADVLPAAAGTERSRGVGQRTTISPLDVLRAKAGGAKITYSPGIDRVGTVVPAAALSTSVNGPRGLTRTETDSNGAVLSTQVDSALTGRQTDLTKGNNYGWTGYVNVPNRDTYTLSLQRPAGTVVGTPSGPNGGVNPGYQAGPFTGVFDLATLSIDGTAVPLNTVSTLHPNDYRGGPTVNGQYLGLNVTSSSVPLTRGKHRISITYATSAKAASAPTLALTWAAQGHELAAAAAAAAAADTAVVFVDDANTTTAAGDVSTLGPGQDALIRKVANANPRTVVVLNTGAAVQMPWLSRVKGVLEMWFPGQEGGTATADLLLGAASPSGRLPITFPRDNRSTPFASHPERSSGVDGKVTWSEGLQIGYRWYLANHVKPLFPFGFGLSYTSFRYDRLRVSPPRPRSQTVTVTFRVRNVGRATGTAVPQVYLTLPNAADEPSRRLVGFDRVTLRPGAAATMRVVLKASNTDNPLAIWDNRTHTWRTPTGRFGIQVGSSVSDLPLAGRFVLG